ncbi:MAG: PhoH family protein [Clostridia bacterium]|nr:PhoH family protein [Clostridia bacterium]
MAESIIHFDNNEQLSEVFGCYDSNINIITSRLEVRIVSSNGNCKIIADSAEKCDTAFSVISYLKKLAVMGETIDAQRVDYAVSIFQNGEGDEIDSLDDNCIYITQRGRPIKPKTIGQKRYCEKISSHTITFGIGPAGTGKTFLSVAMAVAALKWHEISRIILTRPAVEAGERLGYLPGDLQSKIEPYLRPLYDALYDTIGAENCTKNIEKGIIEIIPLAYMRGRTLDDCFIILDEAQNTTPEQMKMLLTRIGQNSKAVVNGDLSQTDLPYHQKSGLLDASQILADIDEIAIHNFTRDDVVRHRLVKKIIEAYENRDKKEIPIKNANA